MGDPPLAMPVPRFPPVPSSSFDAPDGVRITSDAGSIITTVQLTYEPVQIDKARPAVPGQELRKAFTLRAFDHEAGSIRLDLRRPLVLEIPVRDLTRSFETPDRLLIARYHDSAGWVPLVTHYHRSLGVLRARVSGTGSVRRARRDPIRIGPPRIASIAGIRSPNGNLETENALARSGPGEHWRALLE